MAGNGLLDSGGGGGGGVEEQHLRAAEPCTRRRRVASHEAVERLEQHHAHGAVPVRCHRPHLVGHGRSWSVMVGHGGSWLIMADHGELTVYEKIMSQ